MDPFLKWAGGKRWLRKTIADLKPGGFNRYIEPFLGSGAIYFHLLPSGAILSDANPRLIEAYQAIKEDALCVWANLSQLACRHSDDHYYEIRARRYESKHERAAQFIYLNRTCWNGLYRVNLRGEFNVPKGTKDSVILATDDPAAIGLSLQNAELYCEDFETAVDRANDGDLVYCDPPYTVHHNMNGFLKYNENIFSWEDQVRLKFALEQAVDRGAKIILSNASHKSILDLYEGFGRLKVLDRASVISGIPKGRGRYGEVLVCAGW